VLLRIFQFSLPSSDCSLRHNVFMVPAVLFVPYSVRFPIWEMSRCESPTYNIRISLLHTSLPGMPRTHGPLDLAHLVLAVCNRAATVIELSPYTL
jgi:hypothetical protein